MIKGIHKVWGRRAVLWAKGLRRKAHLKEEGRLRHRANGRAQPLQGNVPDVVPVHQY